MTASPTFADFDLDPRLRAAVADLGFETPTPIQIRAIPLLLAGRDVVGGARTGSGKTAAFGLPVLHRLLDGGSGIRALLLAPTRELALQVTRALESYAARTSLRILPVYGGTPYEPQLRALRRGVDAIVGTPGRVLDLVRGGHMDLSGLEILVLDEADEMLNLGFIDDVEAIVAATPETRQVALFSATMPPPIRRIADAHLVDPVTIQVEEEALTTAHITQRWMRVPPRHRLDALERVLLAEPRGTALVFARTRARCAEIADTLATRGVAVDALHGDLNQKARERVLRRLRSRRLDLLIATDVAARGIDVEHITHVINLELPRDTETYVHRIGRTGRAGRDGVAITFVSPREVPRIRRLARALDVDIEEMEVPTGAAIARARRRRLRARMADALADGADDARAWVARVCDAEGWSPADVAAAAVHLLAQTDDIALGDVPDTPPPWVRPKRAPGGAPEVPDRVNEVELFFPVGRTRRVRPADLVGAIANEAGVPGSRIGRITIVDRKSFVGVPRSVAEKVLADHPTLEVRGVPVPVSLARPRPDRNGPRPSVADRRGPPRKRHGPDRRRFGGRWKKR